MVSQWSSRTRHAAMYAVCRPLSGTSRQSCAPPAVELEFAILEQDQAIAEYAAQYVLYQQGQDLQRQRRTSHDESDPSHAQVVPWGFRFRILGLRARGDRL